MNPVHTKKSSRRSALPWAIAVAALAFAVGCESFEAFAPPPDPVDLSPLLELETAQGPSARLATAFPDYEAVVVAGVQQRNGTARRDGIVDLVKETYDSELDEFHSWTIDVTVTMFDSATRAVHELDSSCYSFAHGGAPDSRIRWQDGVYCAAPVVRRPNDPENLYQPTALYSSWVFVRRDRIVLRLYERHENSPRSAKNAIIQELAARLAKLSPAPPAP